MKLLSENREKLAKLMAKVWQDPKLKEQLLEQPSKVLGDFGVEVPSGRSVTILENSPKKVYFMLPELKDEMTQAQLDTTPSDEMERHQKIIAQAWKDSSYKQKLLSQPDAVLKDAGLEVPEGAAIEVKEETSGQTFLLLPMAPKALTDEQLDAVAGAGWVCSTCSAPPSCFTSSGCP